MDFLNDTILTCFKCGSKKLLNTPTMSEPIEHNGNKLIFTVCSNCWAVNEFVNGVASRIILMPFIIKGTK